MAGQEKARGADSRRWFKWLSSKSNRL